MPSEEYDYLTQLFTRSAFDESLSHYSGCATADCPNSLIMADIDHFKKVNDSYGHQIGDQVLSELARRLKAVAEGKGHAYRFGGEEFALILPNHDPEEALAVAERARQDVERAKVGTVTATCSYGVASVPTHATAPEEWLKKADEALYDAKALGRNIVRLSGEPPPKADQPRETLRKLAVAGHLSDEEKESMRLRLLQ